MNNNKRLVSLIISIIVTIVVGILYILFQNQIIEVNKNTNTIVENVNNENLKVYFFKVGNADCTLIINKREAMLIDGANEADASLIYEYIKENKIYDFKYVVATHSDQDHIAGLDNIIANMNNVDTLFMPNTDKKSDDIERLMKVANSKSITIRTPKTSDTYTLGNATFEIKWIAPETEGEKNKEGKTINKVSSNQSSIVIELKYGMNKFLFMGDYEVLPEKYNGVKNKYYKEIIWDKVDLVKVSHHGSESGLIEGFYKSTNPDYAIISAGASESQNNPDEKVKNAIINETKEANNESGIKELENRSAETLITEEQGTIIVESDGTKLLKPTFIDRDFDGNM